MIVADTSALMAILLNEPEADACMDALSTADALAISAGTMAEALIVADRRGCGDEMRQLLDGLGLEVTSITAAAARSVADAYARWGKGVDVAGLNFGDCFAYALAAERSASLLYVGNDFGRTDVRPALPVA
ncbi:type II toxin-antitoxin system VapC family toxin [Sphingomonas sp. RB3P16]|uniref:type II toxin-antitoxin system VapC family toxin n=1 Tax=Parasphingomonas frigoris TaxID=3096163 RepID=UPI002FCC09A5